MQEGRQHSPVYGPVRAAAQPLQRDDVHLSVVLVPGGRRRHRGQPRLLGGVRHLVARPDQLRPQPADDGGGRTARDGDGGPRTGRRRAALGGRRYGVGRRPVRAQISAV